MSNNKNNENSNVIEIVYMTTQPKTDLPTHVTVRSTGRISTVLCEQVYSVSTERVGTYIGECTDKEMENIDIALMISLQLDGNMKTSKKYNETIKEQQEEIDSLKKEIEMLQQEHEDTIAEIEQDAAVYVEENRKIANRFNNFYLFDVDSFTRICAIYQNAIRSDIKCQSFSNFLQRSFCNLSCSLWNNCG